MYAKGKFVRKINQVGREEGVLAMINSQEMPLANRRPKQAALLERG